MNFWGTGDDLCPELHQASCKAEGITPAERASIGRDTINRGALLWKANFFAASQSINSYRMLNIPSIV